MDWLEALNPQDSIGQIIVFTVWTGRRTNDLLRESPQYFAVDRQVIGVKK